MGGWVVGRRVVGRGYAGRRSCLKIKKKKKKKIY